jgi:hypothetical protein
MSVLVRQQWNDEAKCLDFLTDPEKIMLLLQQDLENVFHGHLEPKRMNSVYSIGISFLRSKHGHALYTRFHDRDSVKQF